MLGFVNPSDPRLHNARPLDHHFLPLLRHGLAGGDRDEGGKGLRQEAALAAAVPHRRQRGACGLGRAAPVPGAGQAAATGVVLVEAMTPAAAAAAAAAGGGASARLVSLRLFVC